ncbi:putative groEL-like equatorial domain superfamily [Helianthus annuus]|nr:putative groEL-like equatorial domain superfamily [Helianthus annuus]
MIIKETKCNIHDALCVARNLIRNNSIVLRGGSARKSCSIEVEGATDKYPGVEQVRYIILSTCFKLFAFYRCRFYMFI